MSDPIADAGPRGVLDAWDGAHADPRLLPAYIGDVIVPLLDGWKDFIMGDEPAESAVGDIKDTVPVLMGRAHFRDLVLASALDPEHVNRGFVDEQIMRPMGEAAGRLMTGLLSACFSSPLTDSMDRRIRRASDTLAALADRHRGESCEAATLTGAAYLAWWSCDGTAALDLGLRALDLDDGIRLAGVVIDAVGRGMYPHMPIHDDATRDDATADGMPLGVDPADPMTMSGPDSPMGPTL